MSQAHNLCLVTDTSAAGSSSRLAAQDVRDDPSGAPRAAHTRLGSCARAPASPARPRCSPPPKTYSAELVPLTAEPSGAGFSWMGVGFFLGILDPGKALSTPRGGRPLLLPPSELPRARRAGPSQGRGPGGCLRGSRPARSLQGRGASGGLGRPTPHLLGSQGIEGLPRRRSTAARDSLPLSLSPPVPGARGAPPRAHHSAAPATVRESAPPPLPCSKRLGAVVPEGLEGGGGVGKAREGGSLAPRPRPGQLRFPHSHSAPPLLPRRQPMGTRLGGR